MSAQLKTQYQLRPMQMDDLDAIIQIEATIYTHPWTRGNFSDSLNSGYSAWVLEEQALQTNHEMIGYASDRKSTRLNSSHPQHSFPTRRSSDLMISLQNLLF